MKAIIGTKNQGKVESAKKALEKYFDDVEIIAISVSSEVNDQPVNLEIVQGAKNRVKNLKQYCIENNIQVDLYMAIESGMQDLFNGEWMITNIAVIENSDGIQSVSTSASFPLPRKYVEETKSTNLSEIMNKVFQKDETRHKRGGGIELLTHGEISRIDLSFDAFVMALTKFINEEKWK